MGRSHPVTECQTEAKKEALAPGNACDNFAPQFTPSEINRLVQFFDYLDECDRVLQEQDLAKKEGEKCKLMKSKLSPSKRGKAM